MDDDHLIIARAQTGASDACRALVERYQGVVWTFCRNLLHHSADAEDATQEVFLTAFRRLDRYDPDRAAFSTWLLTIARNHCCNRVQQRQPAGEPHADPLDGGSSPEEHATDAEVWQELDRALEHLPLEQRTAFVLAEIQDRPHAEIALIEGVELGTVKSRVSRAKARLREVLQDWFPEPSPVPLRRTS